MNIIINNYKRKIVLGIRYNGHKFYGWQYQKNFFGIQNYVEKALSLIANEQIKVFCAGRTDAGVHATNQVLHFTTNALRSNKSWTLGVNSYLPNDISVSWAINTTYDFHARFSAIARRYKYIVYNHKLKPAIFNYGLTHYPYFLDIIKMKNASQYFIGDNNFSAFRSIQCQSSSFWRKIYYLNIFKKNNYIIIDIKGNSFLHNMVRNIVGSLLKIGSHIKNKNWIIELLNSYKISSDFITAPASGLHLVKVYYPSYFILPNFPSEPFIFC